MASMSFQGKNVNVESHYINVTDEDIPLGNICAYFHIQDYSEWNILSVDAKERLLWLYMTRKDVPEINRPIKMIAWSSD